MNLLLSFSFYCENYNFLFKTYFINYLLTENSPSAADDDNAATAAAAVSPPPHFHSDFNMSICIKKAAVNLRLLISP